MRNNNTLFWGVILILAGGLFLIDNLGIFRIDVGAIFWPLLLILFGAWVLISNFMWRGVETEHANIPLEGASRAHLRVRHGAGRLNISAGAGMGDLVVGDFGGGLDFQARRSGDQMDVEMCPKANNFPMFGGGPGRSLDWTFSLARDLPLSLEFETGANEARINLSELLVTDLSLNSGASSTDITMPANAGVTAARIRTGAASVNVHIPEGVAARIQARGGLASISVDSARFPRSGGGYESPDYGTAANKIDLDIETGVGSVEVR